MKYPNIGLAVFDSKTLINNRNIIPDFHSFNNNKSFQSKKLILDYPKNSPRFIINNKSTYKPLNIKPLYKIFDHILQSNNIEPQKNDKIICEAQRRIIHPYMIDEVSKDFPIDSKILTIVCINQINLKGNVYTFLTNSETIKKELSTNYMFILFKKNNNIINIIPSTLTLDIPKEEGIEDILVISYFQ